MKELVRRRPTVVIAGALAAIALVVGLWRLAHDVKKLHADIANGSTLTRVERALVPAETAQIARREIFPKAAAVMPATARFAVLTGNGVPGQSPAGLRWIRPFAAYWLLPRRLVGGPQEAQWVLSYGGDLSGIGTSRRIELAPGVVLARVRP